LLHLSPSSQQGRSLLLSLQLLPCLPPPLPPLPQQPQPELCMLLLPSDDRLCNWLNDCPLFYLVCIQLPLLLLLLLCLLSQPLLLQHESCLLLLPMSIRLCLSPFDYLFLCHS
jgi:hypothetical protein